MGQVFFSNKYFSQPILVQIEQNGMQMKEEAWQFMLQRKSFRKHLFISSYSLSKIGYFSDFSDFATKKNHWFSKSPILRPISKL